MFGRGTVSRGERPGADLRSTRRPVVDEGETGAGGLRWPWAVLAAVLGAAGGAALALVARQQLRHDPPGAQEPHELRAVVDRPAPEPPA